MVAWGQACSVHIHPRRFLFEQYSLHLLPLRPIQHRHPVLTHNDFHTPITRIGHGIGSWNQRLALVTRGGLNDFRRASASDQQVFDPDGALQGKRVVVLIAADENGSLPPA